MLRFKTEMMAHISYADGRFPINRRVWNVDGELCVKIEGEWKKLAWYQNSDNFICETYFD